MNINPNEIARDQIVEQLRRLVATEPEALQAMAFHALDEIVQYQNTMSIINILKISRRTYITGFAIETLDYFMDGDSVHEFYIGLLTHSNWHVRSIAADQIGKRGYLDGVDLLIDALNDRYVEVRLGSVIALGELDDRRAIAPLMRKLNDPHKYVRTASAEVLANFRYEPAILPLINLLQDQEWCVRTTAVESLASLKATIAVERIITLLKDRRKVVRRIAAEGLGKIGDIRSVEPLIEALKERQATACSAIIEALGDIGDLRAVKPILRVLKRKSFICGSTENVHSSVLRSLGRLGVVEPIIEALENEKFLVRANAALILGGLRERQAIPALQKALSDPYYFGFGHYPVREAAAKALEQIGYIEPMLE